jgi:hypothetical protein
LPSSSLDRSAAATGWWPEMQLAAWTYEGPPHVGAMRVATAMEGLHYVLHAPQGDTYADLLFTMIERLKKRPPVTYTTFQARDLGGDTAELFKADGARRLCSATRPQAMIVGASCTAELIQDDPGGLARALDAADPGDPARAAVLPEEGELGGRRDLLPDRPGARRPVRSGPRHRARAARPAGTPGRAATSSAPPRSASATATTCQGESRRTPRRPRRRRRRLTAPTRRHAEPTSPASATPTSTSSSIPRSPASPPPPG